MTGYALTFWLLGRRYRTYDCFVADEAREVLGSPGDFKIGKAVVIPFVVRDGRLITSRWPGIAMKYSQGLVEVIEEIIDEK